MKQFKKIAEKLNFKNKPDIYIDLAVVVPRKDFKRHFEFGSPANFDRKFSMILEKKLPFKKLSEADEVNKNSLILDVAISEYQFGSHLFFDFGNTAIPLIWRPKIQLRSRIYQYSTKKNVAEFIIKKKLPLKLFFNRIFHWRFLTPAETEDTHVLLSQAVTELKQKINKKFF